ncbi:MAG TPA: glycosyl transferase family 1, partial [Bacteroidales bacterium]|nr:glycosyl transferase family 1 [Bacteroidales bacterium]
MLEKRADRKHHQLEFKVLKNADALTVVSPGMSKEFTEIYNRNYAVIPNGFDTSDFKKTEKLNPESGFSLAHIGALVKTRNPLILWKVLNELCKESDAFSADLKIKLIGNVDVFVRESLQANELMDKLEILPYLPHEEVVIEQMRAQVLLLLINRTPNAHLILTGKLFEYMGAGRPILGIGPVAGDAAAILKETGAGVMVDFEEEEKLKHYIRSFYQKFQNGSLINSPEDIYQYSRYELTRKMANEFDRITSR